METWLDDEVLCNAIDRLLISSAPDLDIIIARLDETQSVILRAQGDVRAATLFGIGFFAQCYKSARTESEMDIPTAFNHSLATVTGHPLCQLVVAQVLASKLDKAVGAD